VCIIHCASAGLDGLRPARKRAQRRAQEVELQ